MDEPFSSKQYEPPPIDLENKNNSQTIEIEFIGYDKKVLEIGTSTGYVSKILKDHGNIITGIEIDREAGLIAKQYCVRVIIGDVEALNLDSIFEPSSFDVILCGDVLEHLINPASLLKNLRKFLRPGGYLVVSLPNFFHGDVLLNLLFGDFRYTRMGLLDQTHLRFFGLKNIYRLFAESGYQITKLLTTNLDLGETELKTDPEKVPKELLKFLRSLPNSTVYQFVFIAYPSSEITLQNFVETDLQKTFFSSLEEFEKKFQDTINELKNTLSNKDDLINETNEKNQQLLSDVSELLGEVSELNTSLTRKEEINLQISEKNKLLSSANFSLQDELTGIKTSITWQLNTKFHQKIIERFFSQGTKRRGAYDLCRAGGKILINDGFHAFQYSFNQFFHIGKQKREKLDDYQLWIEKNEPGREEIDKFRRELRNFSYKPKISIITPVWNVDERWLRRAIESVINQDYDNWELCLVDGGSTKQHIKPVLTEYASKYSRIKVHFLAENKGIAGNSNAAIALASGEFVGFLDHDDELAQFSLYEIVKTLNKYPDICYIYSDEDKIDEQNKRVYPFFKSDWSPDMFLSCNYLCHFSVVRKKILDEIGGFQQGYDGSQDYDLFLRITEKIKNNEIFHIPKILYHWRVIPDSAAASTGAKPYAYLAAKKALTDSMARRKIDIEGVMDGCWTGSYRINYSIHSNPKISIIIPTKDKIELLRRCINSILEKTTYKNYELLIVDNQSESKDTFDYYEQIKDNLRIHIVQYNKPFNFSAINNYAVTQVTSPYILFLNNDTEVISGDWLSAMLEHAQRVNIGAVGAKLLYPNRTIQHAGIILGIIGDPPVGGHAHRYLPDNNHGYSGRADIIQNVSAVTAACLLMRKEVFEQIRGFDENLAVAFNDVDFCLRIRDSGHLIVYTPFATLIHHESLSRGHEDTPEKRKRFLEEVQYIRKKWGEVIEKGDPYYNPNLTRDKEDFSINRKECDKE
jgi:GT2 family glycosyltransferase/2-polyprenyl-3-methyl-5-hydroxy-6-metoxy-1,4-benzoquinol methylase